METIYNFFSLIYFFLATQNVNKHPPPIFYWYILEMQT